MGSTINLFCDKCGYHHRFFIGIGFNYDISYIFYNNMQQLRMMVKNLEDRINIRDIMHLHPDAKVLGSESRIYHCSYCRYLKENYYFKIDYENENYLPHYYCPRCETKMAPIDIKGLTCPNCGNIKMKCNDGEIDWD